MVETVLGPGVKSHAGVHVLGHATMHNCSRLVFGTENGQQKKHEALGAAPKHELPSTTPGDTILYTNHLLASNLSFVPCHTMSNLSPSSISAWSSSGQTVSLPSIVHVGDGDPDTFNDTDLGRPTTHAPLGADQLGGRLVGRCLMWFQVREVDPR